jgi:hypothetical protein
MFKYIAVSNSATCTPLAPLHRGVLPLVLPREDEGGGDANPVETVRISAAFNVVFEGHELAGAGK